MSEHATEPRFGRPLTGPAAEAASKFTGYWWLWLVAGIAWIAISAVLLQFDQASVTTVGVLVGLLFLFAGAINVAIAAAPREAIEGLGMSTGWRWLAGFFSVVFFASAIACFITPSNTFVGLADMLGFLFLLVGLWWMIRAFEEKAINEYWWLGLISGILMTILGFWTAGQFWIDKAYLLLVFAGIWALMEGIVDIVRAFQIRELHKEVEPPSRSS
jgi:uncharacterized membrane protein HdeD (DUF308 family)